MTVVLLYLFFIGNKREVKIRTLISFKQSYYSTRQLANQGSETEKTWENWSFVERKIFEVLLFLFLLFFLYTYFFSKHRNRGRQVLQSTKTRTLSLIKDKRHWSLWNVNEDIVVLTKDIEVFRNVNEDIIVFWKCKWLKTLKSFEK